VIDVVFEGRCEPAARFAERVQRSVSALRALGIGDGDAVALMTRNTPESLALTFALRWLGAAWLPVNWHFKHDELAFILGDSEARLFIAEADLLAELSGAVPAGVPALDVPQWQALRDAAAPNTEPARPPRGAMLYTSGTTGRPKGIQRNAATPEQAARALLKGLRCYGFEPGMRALLNAPVYHSAPNGFAVMAAQVDGAALVLERRFDPEGTLRTIEEQRITHAYLVPTMYVRMLRLPDDVKRRHDLSSIRFVSSTGSPCAPDVKRAMIDWWGPVFNESYGSSELGYMTLATSADAVSHPGTAGRALPGTEIRILDEAGRELPAGEPGLIYVRQPAMADFTYRSNDEARRAMERDGFLTMKDVGLLDAEGYLYIVDRASDMVISGGVNIYPVEIERVLLAMPGVEDCAVFGIPHAEFGETLAAVVQPRRGAALHQATSALARSGVSALDRPCALTADGVKAYLRERLAGYKVPSVVDFQAELPREDTGKIFKRKLREPYWAGQARRV
jgi:long-chain acyl-CoA synthetase